MSMVLCSGFEFSDVEPSALVQFQGGPCAVIAPVQAFLLKKILTDSTSSSFQDVRYLYYQGKSVFNYFISQLTPDKCKALLIQAICNILAKCKDSKYRIVSVQRPTTSEETINKEESDSNITQDNSRCSLEEFHRRLSVKCVNSLEEVEKFYADHFNVLSQQFGVLLFLYTVLLTKGIENVKSELSDTTEPLIHNTYGYGAQGLINLMMTGCAVSHVFDNVEDVGGLRK